LTMRPSAPPTSTKPAAMSKNYEIASMFFSPRMLNRPAYCKRPRFPEVCAHGDGRVCDRPPAPRAQTLGFKAITSGRHVSRGPSSSRLATLIPTPRLLSRLLDTMVQHVFGVRQRPTVRQQGLEKLPARVHRKLQNHFA
jgi:hypothetical protein